MFPVTVREWSSDVASHLPQGQGPLCEALTFPRPFPRDCGMCAHLPGGMDAGTHCKPFNDWFPSSVQTCCPSSPLLVFLLNSQLSPFLVALGSTLPMPLPLIPLSQGATLPTPDPPAPAVQPPHPPLQGGVRQPAGHTLAATGHVGG